MRQTGEYLIAAPRAAVWEALNDPSVLARCIPGCESFTAVGESRYEARVRAKVGPLSATFQSQIELADVVAPERYTLSGGLKGNAGFASGAARIRLDETDDGTRLSYEAEARIGGKLAQLASRLIDAGVRKTANDFFSCFNDIVSAAAAADGTAGPQ